RHASLLDIPVPQHGNEEYRLPVIGRQRRYGRCHCSASPMRCATSPHCLRSDAMKSPKAAGDIGVTSPPFIFSLKAAVAMVSLIAWFSMSTIAGGVPAGATMPAHEVASNPG